MLRTTGTVVRKEKKINPVRVDLRVKDLDGNVLVFQVRPKNITKLIEIDTNDLVEVLYRNDLSDGINNLIAEEITILP